MMKSFFKKLAFVMALAMVVSTAAPAAQSAAAATEFTYAYQNAGAVEELYMKAGDEVDLCFKGVKDYKNYDLQWKSANPLVATVDKNGVVKAVENGTTTIELVVGDGSVYTSTPVKVVVGEEIKVTLGTSEEDTFATKTLEVGTSVELDFFGVPNYSETNYSYTWISNAPEVVKVDQKGVCVAVASGSATVTVTIVNNVTGDTLTVAPVVITVPTPVVELTYEVKQVSDTQAKLVFNDTVNFNKSDVTLEIVYDGGYTATWPIKTFSCKDNVITFEPYVPFADGDQYIVKVGADDEGTAFTTKIGVVDQVEVTYFTDGFGDMGKGKAFTNGEDGPLTVKFEAKLYSQGVDVSKVYNVTDVVYSLGQENEYVNIDEYGATIEFYRAGERATVIANYVYYDENDDEHKVPFVFDMVSELPPAYSVVGIKAWTLVTKDQTEIDWSNPLHTVPAGDNERGYKIVAVVEDNYKNLTCTVDGYKHKNLKGVKDYTGSRFATENYDVKYSSSNVQQLLVGENGKLSTYTKTDTYVIFGLYDTDLETDSKFVRNIFADKVVVKDARVISKVTVESSNLTLLSVEEAPIEADYTKGTYKVKVYDQYGVLWDKNVDLAVECSVANTEGVPAQVTFDAEKGCYEGTLYGNVIDCDKTAFNLVFKTENGKSATLKVSLKAPKYTDDTNTQIKVTSYKLAAEGASQTIAKQDDNKDAIVAAKVNYYELSNGYAFKTVESVPVDGDANSDGKVETGEKVLAPISLATSKSDLELTTKTAVRGEQFVVVYYPNGNIVPYAGTNENNDFGVIEENPGQYVVVVAHPTGVKAGEMKYDVTGTYTVKVLQVSSFNKKGEAVFSTKYSTSFKIDKDNPVVDFADQTDLDVTDNESVPTTKEDVVVAALSFKRGGKTWTDFNKNMIEDVTVVENRDSNYIVITEVTINVPLNGSSDAVYYTVKVPVNKAIKVSSDYNWTPEK